MLKPKQIARVDALKASREVLAERTTGPFNANSKSVDVLDLYNIACWIFDGEDPWRPVNQDSTGDGDGD